MNKRVYKILRTVLYILYVTVLSGLLFYLVTLRHTGSTKDSITAWVMTGIMAGGTLMMSVFGFSLFRTRPQERALLFFAGYCLATTVRMLFLQDGPATILFPRLDERAVLTLRALGTLGSGAFHFNFIFDLFGEKHSPKLRRIINGGLLVLSTVVLFLRLTGGKGANLASLAAGIPLLVFNGVLIARSGKLKKNPVNWIFFITTVIDIFSFLLVILHIPNIAIVWNFIYTISITFFMADRYAKAMNMAETVNEQLEQTVAERTADLRKLNLSLTESEKSIRELVRGISHDLKTPLAVLGVNLEMLRDEDVALDSENYARYVDTAWQKSRDLTRLTKGLFEAAQMGTASGQLHMEWTLLSALLTKAHEWYAADVESSGISFTVSFEENCDIWTDREMIRRVLDNLVNNALRYTPEGGNIAIRAGKSQNGMLPIIFSDTGCGIAQEHLPHIFEAYYKADSSRSGGDSGLGMYIAKTAMESMEGSISIDSEKGKGTFIIMRLRCQKLKV